MSHAFFAQSVEFAMGPPGVFLIECRNTYKAAGLPVTPSPRLKSPQQTLGINPIRLYAPGPTVDFEACRIHDPARDPRPLQASLKPEPIVTGLEYALDSDGIK